MSSRVDAETWRQVLDIYEAAIELPATEREAYVSSLSCPPEISKEVFKLLESFLAEEPHEPSPAAFTAGEKIGRYVLLERLGRGGMGEVYSARDTELARLVALKFLKPGWSAGRSVLERLKREAKALSTLNHPNIVTVHEVIESSSRLAIVMELVDGEPLRVFTGTPLPLERLLRIGEQVAQALAAAHAQGIIHRDIKPDNIMVRPDGYVKLLDFGLAHRMDGDHSTAGVAVGTLRYMSPEQARFESVTGASDVFSTGVVLYELATGIHPFDAESSFEVVHAAATQNPKAPSQLNTVLPPRLSALLLAMLDKNPSERPSASKVAETLQQIRIDAAQESQSGPSRPIHVLAVALAVLLVAVALAWYSFLGRRGSETNPNLRVQPLTSQVGWEGYPALSPNGDAVAFTWAEGLDRPRQIYVKRLSNESIVKLTDFEGEGNLGALVWSPDGNQIAFKRWYGSSGAICEIPSSGGEEKKITEIATSDFSSTIDWSPDGTQIAFSDHTPETTQLVIYLLNLRTGEKRKLTSPPSVSWGDWDPKFSPDGRTIAFKRVGGFWLDDLYLIPTAGGAVKRFTTNQRGIWGHAWTSDGTALIASCQRGETVYAIWRFPIDHPDRPFRITNSGFDAVAPVTGRRTKRIAWVNEIEDLNIYRIATTGAGVSSRLIASTLRDFDARYAPDGRIAFISDRTGTREIWLANQDGQRQTRIPSLKGATIYNLDWSPDGRQLAISAAWTGKPNLYLVSCEPSALSCGEPRQLTTGAFSDASPTWSGDGRFIYFSSNRSGHDEIWKQSIAGGQPEQVTKHGGFVAHESSDGQWLYFTRWSGFRIWRIPGSRSPHSGSDVAEELVVGPPYRVLPAGWTLTSDEIFFFDRSPQLRSAVIRAYNLSTRQTRSILELTQVFADRGDLDLSVSPDRRWLMYTQLDRSGSNVMVAEEAR